MKAFGILLHLFSPVEWDAPSSDGKVFLHSGYNQNVALFNKSVASMVNCIQRVSIAGYSFLQPERHRCYACELQGVVLANIEATIDLNTLLHGLAMPFSVFRAASITARISCGKSEGEAMWPLYLTKLIF